MYIYRGLVAVVDGAGPVRLSLVLPPPYFPTIAESISIILAIHSYHVNACFIARV